MSDTADKSAIWMIFYHACLSAKMSPANYGGVSTSHLPQAGNYGGAGGTSPRNPTQEAALAADMALAEFMLRFPDVFKAQTKE